MSKYGSSSEPSWSRSAETQHARIGDIFLHQTSRCEIVGQWIGMDR